MVGRLGVVGPSANVSGREACGEFLHREAAHGEWEVDLCALMWGEGDVEDVLECVGVC